MKSDRKYEIRSKSRKYDQVKFGFITAFVFLIFVVLRSGITFVLSPRCRRNNNPDNSFMCRSETGVNNINADNLLTGQCSS